MDNDLTLEEIYETARTHRHDMYKDSTYVRLKNQRVVQECGDRKIYDDIIKRICDELEF